MTKEICMEMKWFIILSLLIISSDKLFGQNKQMLDKWKKLSSDISQTYNFKYQKGNVSLYMFALKISVKAEEKKLKAHSISTSDSICYKLYPKLDSIIKAFDFSIVTQGKPKGSLILPFAVIYLNNENNNETFNIPVADLPVKFQKMFYFSQNDPFLKDNTYLAPIILSLSVQH